MSCLGIGEFTHDFDVMQYSVVHGPGIWNNSRVSLTINPLHTVALESFIFLTLVNGGARASGIPGGRAGRSQAIHILFHDQLTFTDSASTGDRYFIADARMSQDGAILSDG